MIRVVLPYHLQNLAGVGREVQVPVEGVASIRSVLDALEQHYPMLRGTIRDRASLQRRPFIRFFVREEDWSHLSTDTPLPSEIVSGAEPLRIIGAMAGG